MFAAPQGVIICRIQASSVIQSYTITFFVKKGKNKWLQLLFEDSHCMFQQSLQLEFHCYSAFDQNGNVLQDNGPQAAGLTPSITNYSFSRTINKNLSPSDVSTMFDRNTQHRWKLGRFANLLFFSLPSGLSIGPSLPPTSWRSSISSSRRRTRSSAGSCPSASPPTWCPRSSVPAWVETFKKDFWIIKEKFHFCKWGWDLLVKIF